MHNLKIYIKQADGNVPNVMVQISLSIQLRDGCKSVSEQEVNQESVKVPLQMKGGSAVQNKSQSLKYLIPDE